MNSSLPFFNFSLQKALDAVEDSFGKARVRIIYALLLFSILKCLVVVVVAATGHQQLQVIRGVAATVIYILAVKLVLWRPKYMIPLAHVMIICGIGIVWSNIIFFSHTLNIPTIQFIFMIILSSFYVLGTTYGFIYSAVASLPVAILLLTKGNLSGMFVDTGQALAYPGPEIITLLNFISIVIAHYLFYNSFYVNMGQKEQLNVQLQSAIIEANKLAESKTSFLSTMSHELRTPLNAVIGMSELVLHNNTDKSQEENLHILRSSSLDLLSLINNILDLNKTDAQMMVLESVPFHLADLIRDKCRGLSIKARDKYLDFIVDIDPRLERTIVSSDPVRLSQVIYNLVSNAIKFTEKGSITVKLECLQRNDSDAQILFSVKDTGIGIHPDKQDSIFEVFTQAETDTTRNYGGTGLGLAIVKQILVLFNSEISVESVPGNGSSFSFIIDFETAEEPVLAKPTIPAEQANFSHLRILVAEDNQVNRVLLKKQMDKLRVTPTIVENGQYALDIFAAKDFDAIFLDLHMPVLDGYDTIKQIRALPDSKKANIHAIAFTASVMDDENIIGSGFDDFLLKPANISDLQLRLERIAALAAS